MKNQFSLKFIITIALTVFIAASCGSHGKDESQAINTVNGQLKALTANQSENNSPPASVNNADNDLSTPTKSHDLMWQAMRSGDIALYKKTMAQCYLDHIAGSAKRQNITADEFIKKSLGSISAADYKTPPIRNEKISGDKATLEEMDFFTNQWSVSEYTKEADGWKYKLLCEN